MQKPKKLVKKASTTQRKTKVPIVSTESSIQNGQLKDHYTKLFWSEQQVTEALVEMPQEFLGTLLCPQQERQQAGILDSKRTWKSEVIQNHLNLE